MGLGNYTNSHWLMTHWLIHSLAHKYSTLQSTIAVIFLLHAWLDCDLKELALHQLCLIFSGLPLSNWLNWKIYYDDHSSLSSPTASQIWIPSYILHIISLYGKIWTQSIDLAPNVWLHSSVGRVLHRCRRGHGFDSLWSPDIFRASSFQSLKLEHLLRWSLFTSM